MISLPVKYRPQTLDEVVGQDFVVKILKKQIESGKIKNAYLFAGSSGDGKTSTARCFARAINGGVGELIEIDAASNNGVDSIRALIQEAKERSLSSKYKVFIIDEVHVLSSSAWQSFLKCLEEPPAMTVFILCTTDPQKIPETIINRVQRFNFTKIPHKLIKERLTYVCQCEGYTNYEESVDYISKAVNGCMREALTLLGKVADLSTVLDIDTTLEVIGSFSEKVFVDFINALIDGNEALVLQVLDSIEDTGKDVRLFINQLLSFVMNVTKYILFNNINVTTITETAEPLVKSITNFDNPMGYYNYLMDKLLDLKITLKDDSDIGTTARVACLQIARMKN